MAPPPPKEEKPNVTIQAIERAVTNGLAQLKQPDLSPLLDKLSAIENRPPIDLTPVLGKLSMIESRPPIDLAPLLAAIEQPATVDIAPLASQVAGVSGLVTSLAPWVLGLAGTGATGGLLSLAFVGIGLLRRRRGGAKPPTVQGTERLPEPSRFPGAIPLPRELDEARELLRLRQHEGRVGALDALRGMVVDDELQKLIDDEDSPKREFARELRRTLDRTVNSIAPVAVKGD